MKNKTFVKIISLMEQTCDNFKRDEIVTEDVGEHYEICDDEAFKIIQNQIHSYKWNDLIDRVEFISGEEFQQGNLEVDIDNLNYSIIVNINYTVESDMDNISFNIEVEKIDIVRTIDDVVIKLTDNQFNSLKQDIKSDGSHNYEQPNYDYRASF